jgi:hypothetical protein
MKQEKDTIYMLATYMKTNEIVYNENIQRMKSTCINDIT